MHPLRKQPSESETFWFDFASFGRLASNETILASPAPTITSTPSGLTITSVGPDSTSKKVQCRIAGGTHGTQYKLTTTAYTSSGNTLEDDGFLLVENE